MASPALSLSVSMAATIPTILLSTASSMAVFFFKLGQTRLYILSDTHLVYLHKPTISKKGYRVMRSAIEGFNAWLRHSEEP
jgi:hypothetical protein